MVGGKPPDADLGRIIMEEQRQQFMEDSGLERARPEVRIEFSRPQGYIELLEQIKVHGYNLMMQRGEVLSPEEIAADWYDRVYLPTVEAIKREGLWEMFPEATKGDLFLWVTQRRRELFPERGGMETDEAVRAARDTTPKPAALKPRLTKRRKEN